MNVKIPILNIISGRYFPCTESTELNKCHAHTSVSSTQLIQVSFESRELFIFKFFFVSPNIHLKAQMEHPKNNKT
jgi:hypothetical protein